MCLGLMRLYVFPHLAKNEKKIDLIYAFSEIT